MNKEGKFLGKYTPQNKIQGRSKPIAFGGGVDYPMEGALGSAIF